MKGLRKRVGLLLISRTALFRSFSPLTSQEEFSLLSQRLFHGFSTLGNDGGLREMRRLSWKKAPSPPKNLLTGYGSYVLSRGILPAAKLWCLFEEAPQKSASSLLSELLKNPPEFSPAGENSVPRQEVKAFNLKFAFVYRSNTCANLTHITTCKIRRTTIIP